MGFPVVKVGNFFLSLYSSRIILFHFKVSTVEQNGKVVLNLEQERFVADGSKGKYFLTISKVFHFVTFWQFFQMNPRLFGIFQFQLPRRQVQTNLLQKFYSPKNLNPLLWITLNRANGLK